MCDVRDNCEACINITVPVMYKVHHIFVQIFHKLLYMGKGLANQLLIRLDFVALVSAEKAVH